MSTKTTAMNGATLDRPIFVVGHPRSGTTLLASMLGRHPDIASTPESLYLSQARFQVTPLIPQGPQAVAERIQTTPLRHLAPDKDRLVAALGQLRPFDERTIFACLLELFRQEHGKPRILEKSPWHVRHIDELLAWFPDARIIWIVRDGRASVASLRKVPWATHDPKVLSRQWVRNMAFGLDVEAAAGASLTRVYFEKLVADPQGEMERLQRFVEVPFSASVHDHTRKVDTIKPTEQGWKENVNKPLMSGRAEAWREELTPAMVEQISAIMNPTLRKLGYSADATPAYLAVSVVGERLRAGLLYNSLGLAVMRKVYPAAMMRRQRRAPARPAANSDLDGRSR